MNWSDYCDTLNSIKAKVDFSPQIAIVLGSGLGSFEDEIDIRYTLNYDEIKNFPTSTVAGHKGRFIFGYVQNVPVVAMQGRVHFYEGYTMEQVVLPIRIMHLLGAKVLMLSNASGGINSNFSAGDLMIINDHISMFVPNPLIGTNLDELGERFPDMSEIYDTKLSSIISETAKQCNIAIRNGVYAQLTGPSYESKSEVKALKILGADAVGMSTACEAIVAKHCGFRVCGVSLITNLACGISENTLSHKEVIETGKQSEEKFKTLFKNAVINIYNKGV